MKRAISLLFLLVLGGCSGGCSAGATARQEALIPAMRIAWPGIRENVDQGLTVNDTAAVTARAAMNTALATGQIPIILAVDWPTLRRVAIAGISNQMTDEAISVGVALSLAERIDNFDAALVTLRGVR